MHGAPVLAVVPVIRRLLRPPTFSLVAVEPPALPEHRDKRAAHIRQYTCLLCFVHDGL